MYSNKQPSSLFLYDKIDSTNLEAKRHASAYLEHSKVFIAKEQTSGRGRLNREWISSSKDGLYMSILFNSNLPSSNISSLSLISGLSICKSINKFANNKAFIKWPNDIIIENKKVCGILLESIIYSNKLSSIILGIGININNKKFENKLAQKATSLYIETHKIIGCKNIVQEILKNFSFYYNRLLSNKFGEVINEYKNLCVSINRNVTIKRLDGDIEAFSKDIDSKGNLIVITNDFKEMNINSCEVVVQGIY